MTYCTDDNLYHMESDESDSDMEENSSVTLDLVFLS